MEAILSDEQEALLKQTRLILGDLRDVLGQTAAPESDRTALSDSIRQLDDLFLLVVAGEFNAGKSSFINALLGQNLQKEGVTPTTSQIFLLKHGAVNKTSPGERGIWVQTADVPLLRRISIVDTPGTNAILREHEALTSEFIPRSDLVLFLTSADRPFTESERNFLSQIEAWGKKIVLIVNKMDFVTSDAEREQILSFVRDAAKRLLGDEPPIFAISAKQAQQAKAGQPRLWESSGFSQVEDFVQETLDDNGRFRLKLLNPLGVGQRVVQKQLDVCQADLDSLAEDSQLLDDIERQTVYYNDDMQRNFKARIGEVENILYAFEKRGNEFFDETIRFGRIPDLIRSKDIQAKFEEEVVADMAREIEQRVSELIDWMVEQDLRQWTAVAEHMAQRKDDYDGRVVGESGPREGTLAYDRQRLIESIGSATRRAVDTYDKRREAEEVANVARMAVVNAGVTGGVGVGLGVAIALAAHTTFLDVTGIATASLSVILGAFLLPRSRTRVKQELKEKLGELRDSLISNLEDQFRREMRRSAQRIEDTVAPFARFVRAEENKINKLRQQLVESEAHIVGLQAQLKYEALVDEDDHRQEA